MRDPIEQLPYDLLISIFSLLSIPDLIAAQRVSRTWLSYLSTEHRLYQKVSFIDSKQPIPLKIMLQVIRISRGRISSLEFNTTTLRHLTPLVPIYPHLQQLVIRHEAGYLSALFKIAFKFEETYFPLPNLRKAIFQDCFLLDNEISTLLSMAPNLEDLECRAAAVNIELDTASIHLDLPDLPDHSKGQKLKRLKIEHYSERLIASTGDVEAFPHRRLRSPVILRSLPNLEELTLGQESLQVLDLTLNPKIRYLDFLPRSPVISFLQPPPSLQICLNAPQLNRQRPDTYPYSWPPGCQPPEHPLGHQGIQIQLWENPPRFQSLSIYCLLAHRDILPNALSNSYESLVALRLKFALQPSIRGHYNNHSLLLGFELRRLPEFLAGFVNLRFLDLSGCESVDDDRLIPLAALSLEYLCLARTSVTSTGVCDFLARTKGTLKELNVVETDVGVKIAAVAHGLGVKLEIDYPGKPMPGAVYVTLYSRNRLTATP
jgi:F-box-like